MTNDRKIAHIYPPPEFHWVGDGFRVMGYFSIDASLVQRLSPFVLLDYHAPFEYPPTSNTRRGVGPHPHRGFETVTLAFEGSVAHHDSAGNGGVIGPGDVQWMTAARGVLHREYHAEDFAQRGGRMHMIQLWVNLPRAHKLDPPRYQSLTADRMGQVELDGGAGRVRVIAGEFRGARGPALTFTPIDLLDARLNRGGSVDFELPAAKNAALLVMNGELALNGRVARENDFVVFANEGSRIRADARSDAHFEIFAGEPIREPVVQYGPFVMNTQGEIRQAIDDFNRGAFGELAE